MPWPDNVGKTPLLRSRCDKTSDSSQFSGSYCHMHPSAIPGPGLRFGNREIEARRMLSANAIWRSSIMWPSPDPRPVAARFRKGPIGVNLGPISTPSRFIRRFPVVTPKRRSALRIEVRYYLPAAVRGPSRSLSNFIVSRRGNGSDEPWSGSRADGSGTCRRPMNRREAF